MITLRHVILVALPALSMDLCAQMQTYSATFSANEGSAVSRLGGAFHGQVVAKGVDVSRSFVVELTSCSQPGPGRVSSLDADGGFSFQGVESGCHQISVLTLVSRDVVYHDMLNVDQATADIRIDLHTETAERPNSGFVSMQQLLNPPPKKARQAWEKAMRYANQGRLDDAVAAYSRAIELFPHYATAHEGLALAFEGLDRPTEAIKEWELAHRFGVDSPELYSGLAFCLFQLNRKDEAEQAARQALTKDPSYAAAHYLLACSLMSRGKCRTEALNHFSRAAGHIPKALFLSAKLRAASGDFEGARRELGEYLKICPGSERPSVERSMDEVRSHMAFAQSAH